jgi:alkylmercury lyase
MGTTTRDIGRVGAEGTEEVARVFAGLIDSFAGEARTTALAAHRLLVRGRPVPTDELARESGLSQAEVERYLAEWSDLKRDEQGRITAIWGLTIERTRHRFEVEGVHLYTWCAWDTMFIPALIGKSARVRSRCPSTGTEISLLSSPEGPSELSPQDAVISMLIPRRGFEADTIGNFCRNVHFFASREAGERWLSARQEIEGFLLSVEEAFELGRAYNRYRFGIS